MRALADTCLVGTLENELEKKQKQLNIPYYFSGVAPDTVSLTLRITTAEGTKVFKVDAEKSKRNISRSHINRSLHSIVCEERPLSPDSLNLLWNQALIAVDIEAQTSVHISVTDFHERISYSKSQGEDYAASPSSFALVAYVGSCCEVEVCGFMSYSFWQVILFHCYPFIWILVGAITLLSISYYVYRLVNRPPKVVIREVTQFVQSTDLNASEVYELASGFLLDTKRQMLLLGEKGVKLAPQAYFILKLFLDAPEYTLSDNQIVESIWPEDKTADIRRFSTASSRLCAAFREQGLFIKFKRVGSMKYRLILSEDVKGQ